MLMDREEDLLSVRLKGMWVTSKAQQNDPCVYTYKDFKSAEIKEEAGADFDVIGDDLDWFGRNLSET